MKWMEVELGPSQLPLGKVLNRVGFPLIGEQTGKPPRNPDYASEKK
jgi:hypothetical protein